MEATASMAETEISFVMSTILDATYFILKASAFIILHGNPAEVLNVYTTEKFFLHLPGIYSADRSHDRMVT